MTESNRLLKAALFYATKLGWPVLPVKPRAKEPLTEHGCLDATTDEATITEWWTKWPNANIGVRTGVRFFVLDIDPRHGGDDSRASLVMEHGALADTLRQKTGGGGSQYFYEYPDQTEIKCANGIWEGIDVKGVNGYVLVPPSIHPSGNKYAWDTIKPSILEDPVNPADGWLVEAILKGNGKRGPGYQPPPETVPKGGRHKYLVSFAGKLRDMGMGYDTILASLRKENETRFEEPKPDREVEQIARDAATKWESKHPIQVKVSVVEQGPEGKRELKLPESLSVDEVLDLDVPPPENLIEEILPRRGATLLTGPQKVGKTIFAAQTAIAVAVGRPLFEYYSLRQQGAVIVIEQDDPAGDASFKDIYQRAEVPRGTPIRFHRKAPAGLFIGEGFIEWLEIEMGKFKPVLIVLDSYTALRGSRPPGADVVQQDRHEITLLDELGKRKSCLILLLHHESTTARSSSNLDWDARGAGTYGITMATESQISIGRYRDMPMGTRERLVRVRGRHLNDKEFTARLNDRHLFDWLVEGVAAAHYPLVVEVKKSLNPEGFGPKDYENALGVSRATAFRQIAMLTQAGILWKKGHGDYRVAPEIDRLRLV